MNPILERYTYLLRTKGSCPVGFFWCTRDCDPGLSAICNDHLIINSMTIKEIYKIRYDYVIKTLIEIGREDIIFEALL